MSAPLPTLERDSATTWQMAVSYLIAGLTIALAWAGLQ
jgi:hypothetical protein